MQNNMADILWFKWCSICLLLVFHYTCIVSGNSTVPDEQLLYRRLMNSYSTKARPLINDSQVVTINFSLKLDQVIDLDERRQELTTNVFISQNWIDENLMWDPDNHSGIKMLRVPANKVWLPDTFIFNNANDRFSGFMQGVYVLLKYTGSVNWPIPAKLKTTCRVVIAYFPFDDQLCTLRIGSWSYSRQSIDFNSSQESIDLTEYMHNSEWDLVSFDFKKVPSLLSVNDSVQSDLTFTIHLRRQTFFYIFNIIVPCIMLSILTLLTFWLPPTSAEKISLGLSVFLAFSMFMLLIAEEVPATSESIPLIGIYLTTVMTMTSVSVVMAVMVINLYNRGNKAKRPPSWLKYVVLHCLSKILWLRHDIYQMAKTLNLEKDEEEKYKCSKHAKLNVHDINHHSNHEHMPSYDNHSDAVTDDITPSSSNTNDCSISPLLRSHVDISEYSQLGRYNAGIDLMPSPECSPQREFVTPSTALTRGTCSHCLESVFSQEDIWVPRNNEHDKTDTSEEVWIPRNNLHKETAKSSASTSNTSVRSRATNRNNDLIKRGWGQSHPCNKFSALHDRKQAVVEWQTIASVIDRLLFWVFVIGTVTAYVVIVIYFPYTKPEI